MIRARSKFIVSERNLIATSTFTTCHIVRWNVDGEYNKENFLLSFLRLLLEKKMKIREIISQENKSCHEGKEVIL